MTTKVIKSISDSRIYHTFTLDNQLQCLVISDPETQKSSAALSVGIGSLKDPIDTQGLAHYLEHMLFMGTEKYPDENDYSNFITKNSGMNNAYTSQMETNYQLEVSSNVFAQTLDRFAQFFIAPLMSDSSSERQLNAVDSEHSKNIQNDAWRKFQLTKWIAKEGHPYRKFSTGNKDTLTNPNLRKMLLDFYNQNYSSNIMKLVLYGKEDVQKMQEWVRSMFSTIPNRKYEKYQMPSIPYDDGALGKLLKIFPVKDKKTLEMEWVLSLKKEQYKNHPCKYVAHLLGHEGKGSLFSFLMKEGLATSLSSYYEDQYDCYTEISLSIDLTEKGLGRLKDIIEYVLYYIEMLKEKGPQQWVFEEIKNLNKMKFDYMEKKKGMMKTAKMAKSMQTKKASEINIYPYFMEEWKPETISQLLQEMTPKNLIVLAIAKQFQNQCTLTEPVYKTKYSKEDLGVLTPKKCDIGLPQKNNFIPKDLTVLPMGEETIPSKLYSSDFMNCYFKKDHCFKLPKVNLQMRIFFEGAFTVQNEINRNVYAEMMKEDLREFVYQAELAEMDVTFKFVSYFSADVTISGFRDSVMNFVEPYLKQILEYCPNDEETFKIMKEKLIRKQMNYFLEDPYRLAYDGYIRALRHGAEVSPVERLNSSHPVTIEDPISFGKKWKKKVFIDTLIAGNLEREDAERLMKGVEGLFKNYATPLPSSLIGEIRAVSLQQNKVVGVQKQLKSEQENNSAFLVHFQSNKHSIRSDILLKLCELVSKEPAFDYLRTKQQLGYIVFTLMDDHRGVGGITIIVQSGIKTSYEILEYFEKFMGQVLKDLLDKFDEKTFKEYSESLKSTKEQKDKNLTDETKRFWAEMVKNQYNFHRKEMQIDEIPSISFDQFKNFIYDLFYENPKRFEFHVTSHRENNKNQQLKEERVQVKDYVVFQCEENFRKKFPLYSDFYAKV